MAALTDVFQSALIIVYPLFTAISFSLWGVYRISRTTLSRVNKLIRIGYIVLLGLCVFPGSFWLFALFSDSCYGQGSGMYVESHPFQCGHEIVLGMPWWGIVLYSSDILVLIWSIKRNIKESKVNFVSFTVPLLYLFIIRIVMLVLLEHVVNTPSSFLL